MKKILLVFLLLLFALIFSDISCYAIRSDYTGWTKSVSGKRYYYINGIRIKGVHKIGDKLYTFDDNGICIYQRIIPSKKYPYIMFDNDLNHVDNSTVGKHNYYEFDIAPDFDLYVYEGKWKHIPLKKELSDDYSLIPNDNGTCKLSMDLDKFDYNFENGIYRVRVTWCLPNSPEYKIKLENGDLTTKVFYTYCEFNMVD